MAYSLCFAFYSVDQGIQYAERDLFSGFQGRLYSLNYGLIAWKSNPAFLCDELITDPHCQLACLSTDGFDFDNEFLLEQRRNTSSARSTLRDAGLAYPHTPFIPVFNHSDVSPDRRRISPIRLQWWLDQPDPRITAA